MDTLRNAILSLISDSGNDDLASSLAKHGDSIESLNARLHQLHNIERAYQQAVSTMQSDLQTIQSLEREVSELKQRLDSTTKTIGDDSLTFLLHSLDYSYPRWDCGDHAQRTVTGIARFIGRLSNSNRAIVSRIESAVGTVNNCINRLRG